MLEAKRLFGRKVKELRRRKKLTQAQLAERVELSVNYISQIETGIATPTFDTIVKLDDALEVEIKWLYDFTTEYVVLLKRKGQLCQRLTTTKH